MTTFYRFRSAILLLARITGLLPKPVLKVVYGLCQPFGGLAFVFIRYLLLRNLCASIGDNVFVDNHVEIRYVEKLSLGSNVSINRNCYIDAMGGVSIGDDVSIAHQCSLVAFEHSWEDPSLPIRKNPMEPAPIEIADDVWIGAGVRILAGSRIASRCVVGAGSVVTKRTEYAPGYLVAGVPALPKKALEDKPNATCAA